MEDKKPDLPLVTIVTLMYNTGRFVVQTLEAIKANQYPYIQHIIVDDCSTDGQSVSMIKDWIKKNNHACEFIEHKQNQGICRSLNEAISRAVGKYVIALSDDFMTTDRIEKQLAFFESLPENVGVVYGDTYLINDNGEQLEGTFNKRFNPTVTVPPEGDIRSAIFRSFTVPAVSVMIRKKCFDVVGTYDESLFYEDSDMWIRISEKFDFRYFHELITHYRCHPTSTSNELKNRAKMYETTYAVVKKNLGRLPELDANLKEALDEAAENYFAYRCPSPYIFLWKTYRITHNYKILVFCILSTFIRHQTMSSIFKKVRYFFYKR